MSIELGSHTLVSERDGKQIAEELRKSANIVAAYYEKHREAMPPNVASALTREMARLRNLAQVVTPAQKEEDEE